MESRGSTLFSRSRSSHWKAEMAETRQQAGPWTLASQLMPVIRNRGGARQMTPISDKPVIDNAGGAAPQRV